VREIKQITGPILPAGQLASNILRVLHGSAAEPHPLSEMMSKMMTTTTMMTIACGATYQKYLQTDRHRVIITIIAVYIIGK